VNPTVTKIVQSVAIMVFGVAALGGLGFADRDAGPF